MSVSEKGVIITWRNQSIKEPGGWEPPLYGAYRVSTHGKDRDNRHCVIFDHESTEKIFESEDQEEVFSIVKNNRFEQTSCRLYCNPGDPGLISFWIYTPNGKVVARIREDLEKKPLEEQEQHVSRMKEMFGIDVFV